jgi:hypothetical protein
VSIAYFVLMFFSHRGVPAPRARKAIALLKGCMQASSDAVTENLEQLSITADSLVAGMSEGSD